DNFAAQVCAVVSVIVDGWASARPGSLVITKITGGNTNSLYKVEYTHIKDSVILRIFGAGTERFIDRRTENAALAQLSLRGIAPTFHGLFENGRVEGYVEGRDLQPEELRLPRVVEAVSQQMALLHRQHIDLGDHCTIWGKTKSLLEMIEGRTTNPVVFKGIDVTALLKKAREFEKIYTHTQSTLLALFALGAVFTHNDLLSFNIMVPAGFFESTPGVSVTFIDFEYASYNCRAFDIANHFCGKGYGNNLIIFTNIGYHQNIAGSNFVKKYIHAWRCLSPGDMDYCVDDRFISGFENVVLLNVILSHLLWGCWSLVQASYAESDFGFLEYAKKRLHAF
ncbi:unnamed protein product, partial [Ectocarpus fasciculatus]